MRDLATIRALDNAGQAWTIHLIKGDGGSGQHGYNRDGRLHIWVGMDDNWDGVCGTFLHELSEMVLCILNASYKSVSLVDFMSERQFVFDHGVFANMASRVGSMVSRCLPALGETYNHRKKQLKKEKK